MSVFGAAAAGPLDDGQAAYQRGDYATALQLFGPLAENGDPHAQFMMGLANDIGRGVPQDHVKAAAWYRKAAIQGDVDARANLGALYARGEGVPQSYVEAADWWRLAGD
jgi:TPR repeat protein